MAYSLVRADDIIIRLELTNDVKNLLTVSRVQALSRDYNLVDAACCAEIVASLESRDIDSAATTLVEFFARNHNGDDLLRFCEFLRNEAEVVGGSAAMEEMADRIETAVKDQVLPGLLN